MVGARKLMRRGFPNYASREVPQDIIDVYGPYGKSKLTKHQLFESKHDQKKLHPLQKLDIRVGRVLKAWKHKSRPKTY